MNVEEIDNERNTLQVAWEKRTSILHSSSNVTFVNELIRRHFWHQPLPSFDFLKQGENFGSCAEHAQ